MKDKNNRLLPGLHREVLLLTGSLLVRHPDFDVGDPDVAADIVLRRFKAKHAEERSDFHTLGRLHGMSYDQAKLLHLESIRRMADALQHGFFGEMFPVLTGASIAASLDNRDQQLSYLLSTTDLEGLDPMAVLEFGVFCLGASEGRADLPDFTRLARMIGNSVMQ